MTVVWIISAAMLLTAVLLTVYRTLRGPSTLDRLVGVDALVAIAISGLSVWVAYTTDTTVVPGIVALSLVGFIGSIAVARFRVRDDQ
ncbi:MULTISPECIES: monovalent cation/H+ antiporter complex subunit F [Gordonia]|uniref:Na(+)/H(+) antiporter subunit F n=2 Tax=Gordonia TaxID=2053 RepID=L7LR97_9ACTN|nr:MULTISPECIES: monovalent cation/H+ antiporter complex subunit F [Gordonia]AUH67833.1 cation:proton antiporter [Gordonia sp. YC-JH1]KJR05767.1 monovalent cation/H+ antiporter subunit F [Gordonia sihwensis]KXT58278.1 monovalent cation/H+ antiporter subunit F [Gordonia sp. QH-12]MBY4570856.1 cation:proton antiporter [Gordonia sihwensis]WFN92471.1 monovalent cation/H+ antiporter complex subunit F [Gordonia sihwensis]